MRWIAGVFVFLMAGACVHAQTPPAGTWGAAVIPNKGMRAGTGNWMQIPDNPSIAIPVFTVETWVRATSGGLIVTRDVPSGTPSDWQLWYEFSRNRLAFITAQTPPDSYFFTPDNSFTPGQWHHVALVVNGPAGHARLYIDGNLIISPTFSSRNFDCTTGLSWCGYYNNASGAYLQGEIDEARYWNVERSEAQIRATKDVDLPSNDRLGLVGWWRFCDSYEDYSGSGNHGTPMGSPQLVLNSLPFGITCDKNPCDTVVVTIEGATRFCDGDSTILRASAGFRSYRWSTGDTTRSIVVSRTGRYRIDVVSADSCMAAAEVEVRAIPPPTADAGPDRLTCRGVPVTIGGTSQTPGMRYRWEPPVGLSHPDSARSAMDGAASRTYVLTVTNADGCSASDTMRVQVLDGLPISLPDSLHICPGTAVILPLDILGGFPPYRYEWTPVDDLSDAYIRNPVARPPASRWYHVHVSDSMGCSATDSILIVTTAGLDLHLPDSLLVCKGAKVTLPLTIRNGTPPFIYHWIPPDGLNRDDVQLPVCSADTSRWYRVLVRDSLGCEGVDSIFIRVGNGLRTTLPDTISICAGTSVELPLEVTGQNGLLRFLWRPPDGLDRTDVRRPVARPSISTMYRVHISDSLGCEADDSVFVRLYPAANVSITIDGAASFCVGDSVRLVATPGFRSYRWYTPSRVIPDTGNSIIAREAGNHRVAVIDSNGCETLSQPVSITTFFAFEVPVALHGTQPLCEGDTLLLEADGGYRDYVWADDSGRVLGTGPELRLGRAVRVRVYARDSLGCIGRSREIEVTVAAKPVFSISGPRIVCMGSVHDYTTLLRSRWEYQWTVDSGIVRSSANRESARIEWSAAGRMLLRLRVRDTQTGCEDSVVLDITVITDLEPHILAASATTFCEGDSVVLRSRDAHPRIWWTDATGARVGEGRSLTVRSGGMYTLHAETDDGCGGVDSMLVTAIPTPLPRIVGPVVVCVGDTASYLALVSSGRLRWESSGGVRLDEDSIGIVQHWTQPGRFRLVVVASPRDTGLHCEGSDTLEVEVQNSVDLNIAALPDTIICEGDSVRLIATSGLSRYEWLLPDGTSDTTTNVLVVRTSGTFRVRAISSGGCVSMSGAITVQVRPAPDARIGGPTTACTGGIAHYAVPSAAGTSYQWSVEGGSPESAPGGPTMDVRWGAPGRARLILVADNGRCQSRDTLTVDVGDSLRPGVYPSILRLCPGADGTLHAEDGFQTYTWLTPDGPVSGKDLLVRQPGLYRVHVTSGGGCEGTSDPIIVETLPAPEPRIIGPNVICPGDSITLEASAGYKRYIWSNGSEGRNLTVNAAAVLTVTVVDSNGCTGTSPPHGVTVLSLPEAPVITRTGMKLVSTAAASYQWYRNDTLLTGETERECAITLAGEYRVVVSNADGCPATSPVQPISCVTGRSLVSLPHLVASPGDTVVIVPQLLEQGCLEEIGARTFIATLRYEQSVMVPIDGTDGGFLDGSDRVVSLGGNLQALASGAIHLRFLATLGMRDSVPLVLDSFEWVDVPVSAELRDGSLRILICHEGGDRLFDASGQVRLLQSSPNPFNAMTTVSYELIERATTELAVVDMLGRRVNTLFSGIGEPGVHRIVFDAGGLPSGQYIIVLRTPTVLRQRMILLVK